MNKFIFLVFFLVAFGTAQQNEIAFNSFSSNSFDFFVGFSSVFGLKQAAEDILTCPEDISGVFRDIDVIFRDLENHKIAAAISELIELFKFFKTFESECLKEGLIPFITKFEPAIFAFERSKAEFLLLIADNFGHDPIGVLHNSFRLAVDLRLEHFEGAGEDFGNLARIALITWIPLNKDRFVLEYDNSGDFLFDNYELSPDQAEDFFMGFSSVFNLKRAAYNLLTCEFKDTVNFNQDIGAIIKDLHNSAWFSVVHDFITVYKDIGILARDCYHGAEPFVKEFEPAIIVYENDRERFFNLVRHNIYVNLPYLLFDLGQLVQNFANSDYEAAGEVFGNIIYITLHNLIH